MFQIKIIKNLFLAITMCFAVFGDIFAVPALSRLLKIIQPNGAEFKAYLRGDEYFSWWETEKGTVLFRNHDSGYFEYAKISVSDKKIELISTGIIFVAEGESSFFRASFPKKTKFNLGKIWKQKRDDARKRLQEILEKQKKTGN